MESHNITLRDVPNEDRPRERMMQHGAEALSNAELLAILLRTGTYQESAVRLAERLLRESGGLRALVDVSLEQLTSFKGIGAAKALQIKAGIELGRRLARSAMNETVTIRSPQDAAAILTEDMRYLQKEHFVCLFLNTKKPCDRTGDAIDGQLERFDRASARSVSGRDQTKQRFHRMCSQPSERRPDPKSRGHSNDETACGGR